MFGVKFFSHTPRNNLYACQCEDCDGQGGFDKSPSPPPHVVTCRWLTPDWRESDVSVTIIMQQEMRKLAAERRRTLSHGAVSQVVSGE